MIVPAGTDRHCHKLLTVAKRFHVGTVASDLLHFGA
jgi:hypothetical protein